MRSYFVLHGGLVCRDVADAVGDAVADVVGVGLVEDVDVVLVLHVDHERERVGEPALAGAAQ